MRGNVRVHRTSLSNKEWQLNRLKNQVIKFYKEKGARKDEGEKKC